LLGGVVVGGLEGEGLHDGQYWQTCEILGSLSTSHPDPENMDQVSMLFGNWGLPNHLHIF